MINSLFKKFSSFAKITVTILSLFGNSSLAQSADLRFADIIKNGTSYIVNIEIKGIPAFKFGTSNITFNFNHDVLSSPVLDSAYNYSGGAYNLITVTNPLPGVCSINIELLLANSGQQVDTSWKNIVSIKLDIMNSSGYSGLNFRTISPNRTNIWADDNATLIQQGNYESLDSLLSVENEMPIISSFNLFNNYPNPFNPSTTIKYQLPSDCNVSLKIYNILGSEIAILVNGHQTAGIHSIIFSPLSNIGSGIYFCILKADNFMQIRKMNFIK
jgi:hypothetical protein